MIAISQEAAVDLPFAAISEGQEADHEYVISPALYQHFLVAFGDQSPVHVSEDHARARGFAGPVMHGAILNGFLSHLIGMRLPGRHALLLSADMRYLRPSYLGDRIRLHATVVQRVEAIRAVVLNVYFHNQTRQVLVARARVQAAVNDKEMPLGAT